MGPIGLFSRIIGAYDHPAARTRGSGCPDTNAIPPYPEGDSVSLGGHPHDVRDMPFDEKLAQRIRSFLEGEAESRDTDVVEKKILGGGLGFLREGSMIAGVMGGDLMLRIEDKGARAAILERPHVRALTFNGKPTAAYVLVDPKALRTERALAAWLALPSSSSTNGKTEMAAKKTTAKKKTKTAAKKKTSAKKTTMSAPRVAEQVHIDTIFKAFEKDRRLKPVIEGFVTDKASASGGRRFGSNALKVNGKLFLLFTQGTIVVKLPKDRIDELVAEKAGTRFDPGHGRIMQEWLTVTSTSKALWVRLAKEAFELVRTLK